MIQINRRLKPGEYKVSDVFPDIGLNPILLEIFNDNREIDDVLKKTNVLVNEKTRYMSVNNKDGSIYIGTGHLNESESEILYLDIIHELVHVRQQREGLDLFDQDFSYVDRITEIEAYELTVKEARRIGLTDKQIKEYLQVEWITPEEHKRLARRLNVS